MSLTRYGGGSSGAAADLADHLNDTVDAHDASAISFSPVGSIAATDVQAALVEVAAEASAAVAWGDLTGTLSAQTDLQSALDAKAAASHTHTASEVNDFAEAVDDRVNALLVAGTGITLTYNDPAGTLTVDSTASGAVGTDAIWDAKGDLAVGTGANTASKLTVGTNGHVLTADSAQATGVKWAAITGATEGAVDVRTFGTLNNDGTTDDAAVFQAAAASGARTILAENLNCRIASQIDIPDNQVWILTGTRLVIAGTTQKCFSAVGSDDWALVGPFIIEGDGSTVGTATAVHVEGCNRWKVSGLTAKSIKGYGFRLVPGTPSGTLRGDQGVVDNFTAMSCYIGWYDTPGAGAEYCTILNPMITGCVDGMITSAGNVLVNGGHIVDNTNDGVQLKAGSNHGHGMFTGVNINHNVRYNLWCEDVVNGETFTGCHFYANDSLGAGAIFLDECKGIIIEGGHLDCWIYNFSGASSGMNYIRNMYCPGSYGDAALYSGATPGMDELILMGNFGAGAYNSGISINTPSQVYVSAYRGGSDQTLTDGAETQLVFDTEVKDKRLAYNSSTGTFTVPAGCAGLYRIKGVALCGGTTITATSCYLTVKVTGTDYLVAFGVPYGTNKVWMPFSGDIQLAAGDTLKVYAYIVGGGTATLRSLGWPQGSHVTIERIA